MSGCRGIILEGCSHVGKTSVLKSLKQLHANEDAERSIIVLSEHYSQVLHNVNGKLTRLPREEHVHLIRERVSMLERLDHWAETLGQTQRSKGLFFILERFHLNHRVAFPQPLSDEIKQEEDRLFGMGARCALLTVSSENLEQRIRSRNPNEWESKTSEEMNTACELLLEQQKQYRDQAERSIIPTVEINTDDKDWAAIARQLYSFS